uniref:outer membrane protein assembly factor BamA n=1 Tax=Pararhizobium sp. IMCC3301 TaxID=3067904 RepID=UPI0027407D24|nr:outer membrane protein assembly factor BamA [Pararhizobium sp. IMCC3301]
MFSGLRKVAVLAALSLVLTVVSSLPELGSGSGAAYAQTAGRVVVEGNQRVDDDTIRAYLSVQSGQRYSAVDIDESLKALFATGLFADVQIERRGNTLVVIVEENPILNRVVFEGNDRLKDDALAAIVQSKPRGVFTRAKVQTDTQRVLEMYRRSGRFDASVTPKVIDLAQNRVDLVFEINESAKTSISRVSFIGNRAFSDGKLREVVDTSQKNFLSFLSGNDIYDPDKLNADQERLRNYYYRKGYADFRIISAVADLDRERNRFFVTFTVDEGERYKFGEIEIDSAVVGLEGDALRKVLLTKTGKTYNAELIEKSLEEITLETARMGFPFIQVRPRGDRDYEQQIIHLTYVIDEGPRVYVERINIRGNTRTRDYVIRREFELAEGDAYNSVLVDRAERRLKRLGFFKTVRISREPGSSPDRVILNVLVEDQPTGELSFGAGISTGDGLVGDVSLTEKNFMGRGYFVKASISAGSDKQNYDFAFTDPYFLGRRMSAGFDVYSRYKEYDDYDTERIGGGLRFGLPIRENVGLVLRYGIEESTSTLTGNAANVTPGTLADIAAGSLLTSSVGYTLTYNTVDSQILPRDGEFARISQDFAGVGGDVNYIRTIGDARIYRQLNADWDLVGSVSVKAGNIEGLGEGVRSSDAFFKGGESIRGFKSYGPRDLGSGGAIGGNNFWTASAEVNFPFWGLPESFGLRGAVFADAGSLFGAEDRKAGIIAANFQDEASIRSSVGASVLWQSPFGPLRADIAQVMTGENYDEEQFFRFGGGAKF